MKKYDICIPKNNEKELIKSAKELEYNGLIFLYKFKDFKKINFKDFEIYTGLLIEGKEIFKIKKRDLKMGDFLFAEADGEESTVKAILSNKNIDFIFNLSSNTGRDHTHYRKSTLNQVLAKLALENDVAYIVNFNRFLNEENRIKLMGRISQNIKIFDKFRVPILIGSFAKNKYELRNYSDLISLLRYLNVKKPEELERFICERKDPKFIKKGLKIIE